MLGKKMVSIKKLAKKVRSINSGASDHETWQAQKEALLRESGETCQSHHDRAPVGFFVVYVGEERERFVVPTSFLSHPLVKILLEKSYDESGCDQKKRLVIPCSVSAFQEVVNAVQCCNGKFDFGELVEEFI